MQDPRSVEEVAARTGQPARRLRDWCATGQLVCERAGESWQMEESQVPRVRALAAQLGRHAANGHAVVGLVLPSASAVPSVTRQVAQRLGVDEAALTLAQIVLDGAERALIVWPPVARAGAAEALDGLVTEVGGELLDSNGDPT